MATVWRCGVVGFDVALWHPGAVGDIPLLGNNRYLDSHSAFLNSATACVARAALCNAFAICLHATSAGPHDSSRDVDVLGPNDLLRLERGQLQRLAREAVQSTATRAIVPLETVAASLQLLDQILKLEGSDYLELVDLYARTLNSLGAHNYGLALVLAWTVTEKLLFQHCEAHRTAVPPYQKRESLPTRNAKAGVVLAKLEQLGILPIELTSDAREVLISRNKWLHRLKPVSLRQARTAVNTAGRMFQ